LQHHDILFVAKGLKTRSAIVANLSVNTVCSPQFFIIRIKKNLTNNLMPEFICWQLNQLPAQKYFKSSAEVTLQVSIRRQILESTPITVLDLVQQQSLVKLHSTSVAERKKHQHLIENRRKQLDAIACELLAE
jgi:restriction endonuclease S subunit